MPRHVRNFWVEATVDGRKTEVTFGPRGKGGEFTMFIHVREDGDVSNKYLVVSGSCLANGELSLAVRKSGDMWQELIRTKR